MVPHPLAHVVVVMANLLLIAGYVTIDRKLVSRYQRRHVGVGMTRKKSADGTHPMILLESTLLRPIPL